MAGGKNEKLVGTLVDGRYRVVRELGRGSMGIVYEVVHERLDRPMALKRLHPHLALDFISVARFRREARMANRIGSPHVVEVYDMGQLSTFEPYITMELLDGRDLAAELTGCGPLPVARAVEIAIQICRGLAAAHSAGVIHRDLKPENIFLVEAGGQDFVKLVDFGVSKLEAPADDPDQLTGAGVTLGTPYYMSPEQAWAGSVDSRADLYSLGVVIYEMLAGRRPYEARTLPGLMLKVMEQDAPTLTELRPEVPQELADLVRRLLSPRPDERVQSAALLRQALAEIAVTIIEPASPSPSARPGRSRSVTAFAATLVALTLGASQGCYLSHQDLGASPPFEEPAESIAPLEVLDDDPDFADIEAGLAPPPTTTPGCGAPRFGPLETPPHLAAEDTNVTTLGNGFFAAYINTDPRAWSHRAGPLRSDGLGFVPGAPRLVPPMFPTINPWEGGTLLEGPRGIVGVCGQEGRFDTEEIRPDGFYLMNARADVVAEAQTRGRCHGLAWIDGYWAAITLLNPGYTEDLLIEIFDERLDKIGETDLATRMEDRSSQSIVGFGDRFFLALLDVGRETAHLLRLDPATGAIERQIAHRVARVPRSRHYWLRLAISGERLGFFYAPGGGMTMQMFDADLEPLGDPLPFDPPRVDLGYPFFVDAHALGEGWAVSWVPHPYGLGVALVDPEARRITPVSFDLAGLERWASWSDIAVQRDVVVVGFSTQDPSCGAPGCGEHPHVLQMRCAL